MVEISIKYLGDLRCEARHEPSGTVITTDAPVDNEGRGESFSPTDLAATSLGACMLTIMGIAARKQGVDLGATTVKVVKEMTAQPPRRIAKLTVVFTVPLPASHDEQEMRFDWIG
jgi:putative redox protein